MHISPAKGKGKDGAPSATWRPGWWDFLPLTESPQRPVQWSSCSTMFRAHPHRPTVIVRHFSSSRQYELPAPELLVNHPGNYEPASRILVHPNGDLVFAFFPGRQAPGVGVIWRRPQPVDTWLHVFLLSFPIAAGVVGGQWLNGSRCWTQNSSGEAYRLPPQGARVPSIDISLLLITEDHHACVIYFAHSLPGYKVVKCSLLQLTTVTEDHQPPPPLQESIPVHQCIEGVVGLPFSENSVFVAFRSRSAPVPSAAPPGFDLPLNVNPGFREADPDVATCDLNQLGDESEVHLCQLNLHLKNASSISITARPIYTIDKFKGHVAQMSFLPFPPDKEKNQPPALLFSLSVLEISEYDVSSMKSAVQVYSLAAPPGSSPPGKLPPSWVVEPAANRSFDGAVSFIFPVSNSAPPSERLLYAGVIDPSSTTAKAYSRKKEVAIGSTFVLNVPDLSNNTQWDSTPLWSSSHRYNLPCSAVSSPNQKQLWSSSFSLWYSQTSIHALPSPHRQEGLARSEGADLALAVLSRRSIADIVHCLLPSSPEHLSKVFEAAFQVLQKCHYLPRSRFTGEMVGVALEMYRTKAQKCKEKHERENLEARWHTAQDMLSLAACKIAFEDCGEGNKYDHLAAWQLIKLSSWTIEFTKDLVKKCVLSANAPTATATTQSVNDDLFGSTPNSPIAKADPEPMMTHLVHPFALDNLTSVLNHIRRYRISLHRAPDSEENFLARNVLTDLIDYCPVKLGELITMLEDIKIEVIKLDVPTLNQVLVSCQPTSAVQTCLEQTIKRITESETLLDRARLFIEPSDLLDGISRMSLSAQPKSKEVDIITKDSVKKRGAWTCLRCGGVTNLTEAVTADRKREFSALAIFGLRDSVLQPDFNFANAPPSSYLPVAFTMPKVSLSSLPVSGLFGVIKPSGPTSMSIVNDLQQLVARSRLFATADKLEEIKKRGKNKRRGKQGKEAVKIGQGGTLDPLADGVLVIGVGKGTKKLSDFLTCTKEYHTTCLLGCETDSYDSEGARVRLAPWKHVTEAKIREALKQFTGEISQTPPIFSALKMDGKPLYEYARQGIPLPRPIEPRNVTVHELELVEWKGRDHGFRWPEKSLSEEGKKAMEKALKGVDENAEIKDDTEPTAADEVPTAFVLKMTVSGGTYVRSIVHDLAHAVGSAGHVVTLSRTRQGRFAVEPTEPGDYKCIPWEIFEKAEDDEEVGEDGWTKWEQEVMDNLEIVEGKIAGTSNSQAAT